MFTLIVTLIGLAVWVVIAWIIWKVWQDKKGLFDGSQHGGPISHASQEIIGYLHDVSVDSDTRDDLFFIAKKFDELCSVNGGYGYYTIDIVQDELMTLAEKLLCKTEHYRQLDCVRNEQELARRHPDQAARYRVMRERYTHDIRNISNLVVTAITDIRELNFESGNYEVGSSEINRIQDVIRNLTELTNHYIGNYE